MKMTLNSYNFMQLPIRVATLFFAAVLGGSIFCAPAHASVTSVYVSQSGAGSTDGSSCANAKPASFFNSSSNWGSNSSQIGPGSTVHLCGTISTALTAAGNGASGNPITIQWESGASVSVCSKTGAIQLPGRSWLVLDLGGNSAAIQCPANGSSLSTQIIASGITDGFGGSFDNIEIRNGTIGPIYQKSGTGGDGLSTYGIYVYSGTGNRAHNLTVRDSEKGIFYALGGSSTGNEIDHNTFVNVGAGIYYACGGSSCSDSAGKIHANDFTVGVNWGNPSDTTHMESIHVFSNGGGSSISGIQIYDNYTHGAWPQIGGTAAIFVEQAVNGTGNGTQSGDIFNNICVLTGGQTAPGDGCIFLQSNNNTFGIYNNISDCVSNSLSSGMGMELDGNAGNVFTVKNNIILNCKTAIYNPGSSGTYTFANNDYYNTGGNGWSWQGSFVSFATWQARTGGDANSSTANPGLNSDYTIASSSSWAYHNGANLTSVNDTPLDNAKPTAIGATATTAGTTRPASGAWDLGAYILGGSTTAGPPPNPPSGLTVSVQ